MQCSRPLIAAALLGTLASAAHAQDQSPPVTPGVVQSVVREVRVTGVKELSEADVVAVTRVRLGQPLPDSAGILGQAVEKRYRDEGYSFATVKAAFEESSGTFTLAIDEGVIDRVEFAGVDRSLARTFVDEFALRGGDVFNRARAMEALEVLLRPTRGAIRPGAGGGTSPNAPSDRGERHRTFDRVDRNGERVLIVGLAEPPGRFRIVPDLGDREDWFTPVDGFVPSLGFGAALFDHQRFNHAYLSGHLSYKMASHRAGYAIGIEKPFFDSTKLFLGAELFDLTATDDGWRVSSTEASLAAIGPRHSLRDYYERRGVQLNAAVRPNPRVELLFAWRREQHDALNTRSEFSVWNGDEAFRTNLAAAPGSLDALLVGATFDSGGFDRESLDATYRRHQFENAFGARLPDSTAGMSRPTWRVDWTSEISSPERFGGDFDFRRHIVSGRTRVALSQHQEIAARVTGGWSEGVLPPQRQFAIGGIGSVHGYDFKHAVGDTLGLANLEYSIGWQGGLKLLAFFDAGRVTSPSSSEAPWLKGAGFGVGLGGMRIDVGYPLDSDRKSPQLLLRIGRTF